MCRTVCFFKSAMNLYLYKDLKDMKINEYIIVKDTDRSLTINFFDYKFKKVLFCWY